MPDPLTTIPAHRGGVYGLVDEIRRSCEASGPSPSHVFFPTALPGLTFFWSVADADPLSAARRPVDDGPAVCVVLEGRKQARCASRYITYEPETYSISPVELPLTEVLVQASDDRPFLGLRLKLDVAVLTELLLELPPRPTPARPTWEMAVTPLHGDLIDPLLRLVGSLRDPHDAAVLAPQIQREIAYRLIRGPQSAMLHQIATVDSQLSQIKLAVDWIRQHYAEPFRIETAAAVAHMSASTFHAHFKSVTAMTPLQYQKQLRLHEARRLLLEREADATTASFAVGYESPSQFSRDYKREFGEPPIRDTRKLRAVA